MLIRFVVWKCATVYSEGYCTLVYNKWLITKHTWIIIIKKWIGKYEDFAKIDNEINIFKITGSWLWAYRNSLIKALAI